MKSHKQFFIGILSLFILSIVSTLYAVPADTLFGPQEFSGNGWFGFHYSRHHFRSNETGKGILTIEKMSADNKLQNGFIRMNGKWIRLKSFFKGSESTLEEKIQLAKRNHLTITFWGERGSALSITVSAAASHSVKVNAFSAEPASITEGASSLLSWNTENADTVSIAPDIGKVDLSGNVQVTPVVTTIYTLTAGNAKDTKTAQTSVSVLPPPLIANITVKPQIIVPGDQATLSWQTEEAENVSIDQGIGVVAVNGSTDVSPTVSTTYTLTAVNAGGTTTSVVTVEVMPIRIIIESPVDQSSVSSPTIAVEGRVQTAAQYVEMSVNHRHALVNGDKFLASDLALVPGENTITVRARDSEGNTTQAKCIVTMSETGDWLELKIAKDGGFAPLKTGLTIVPHLQTTLNLDTAILEANGPTDVIITGTAESGYQLSFSDPGFYTLDFQVSGVNSETYRERIFVSVLVPFTGTDWTAMNEGVQQLEDIFNSLLATMDVAAARLQVQEQAKNNPDFSSAVLSSGALCLVFRGLIPVILDLPDPDAPPLD